MALALEVEHGVDDVLEHLGTGQTTVLRDVTNEHGRNVLPLGSEEKLRRRFANLSDAAGRRLELDGEHGLNRVDDHESRTQAGDFLEDALEACFGEQIERWLADAEPITAALDLVLGLFTRGVEDGTDFAREVSGGLQQQRGLADPRFAAEQHQRTRYDPAAEHAIKLADARGQPRRMRRFDLGVQLRVRAGAELRVSVLGFTRRRAVGREGGALLDIGIPRAAVRTFADPLRRLWAAFLADEDGLRWLHTSR
jgi:hypothetical protein